MLQKTSSGQTFTEILNLCSDLDPEHSNPICSHDTPAYDNLKSNQAWLQKDQHYRRYSRKSYFDYINTHYDPDLEVSIQSFHITSHLMMMHHHIQFGYKRYCGSGDIIQANIHWHYELSLWPWNEVHQITSITKSNPPLVIHITVWLKLMRTVEKNELEWIRKAKIKKAESLAVRKACADAELYSDPLKS